MNSTATRKLNPLAKFWTWTGTGFITLAIAWSLFVNGASESYPAESLRISRAYAGLAVTLLAGSALAWTFALYVRQARDRGLKILVPSNTLFEEKTERNTIISWSTVIVFGIAVLFSLILFSTRYSESRIYAWDAQAPLATTFVSSRVAAHGQPCPNQPCFAMGRRNEGSNRVLHGVYEYIPFVTDGALVLLFVGLVSGLVAVFSSLACRRKL